MIVKYDGVPSNNFISLLTFVHSDENWMPVLGGGGALMIVRVKAITPDNQGGGTFYGLTLEILEWLPKVDGPGQNRVDPKYLLKAHELVFQGRSA
ncbi:MAG: hypothetical protein EXS60_01785 [Candidatus Pacebacteria bacterium]|nr:hypothetical protein [Candidatus Paceibacterota bacterium]